ncbi:MAG TPA: substrate-binding domain-containing protein [Chthoniobacterales bacterium]|jgi:ribose transport system substrate-binding protein|nr:substrate-binding domain-containing protein [Chthoniobacterales bacterium]
MLNRFPQKVCKLFLLLSVAITIGACPIFGAPQKPYTIGVSNSYVNVWRSQMLDSLQKLGKEFQDDGTIKPLIIESGTVDIQGQIAQIRNLVARKVDALIVFPVSATALNSALEEASRAGILVIAALSSVNDPKSLNISIDQAEWARISARWLNKTLDGHGDVVVMNGLAGHADNETRFNALANTFICVKQNLLLTLVQCIRMRLATAYVCTALCDEAPYKRLQSYLRDQIVF